MFEVLLVSSEDLFEGENSRHNYSSSSFPEHWFTSLLFQWEKIRLTTLDDDHPRQFACLPNSSKWINLGGGRVDPLWRIWQTSNYFLGHKISTFTVKTPKKSLERNIHVVVVGQLWLWFVFRAILSDECQGELQYCAWFLWQSTESTTKLAAKPPAAACEFNLFACWCVSICGGQLRVWSP